MPIHPRFRALGGPASPARGPQRRPATRHHTKEAAAITPREGHPPRRPLPHSRAAFLLPLTRACTHTRQRRSALTGIRAAHAATAGALRTKKVPIREPPRPPPPPWVTSQSRFARARLRESARPLPLRPPAHAHTKAAIVLRPGTIPRAKQGPQRQLQVAFLSPSRSPTALGHSHSPARGTQQMGTEDTS